MSYYILPKTNNNIEFKPILDVNEQTPYTSHSLFYHYQEIFSQLEKLCNNHNNINSIENLLKLINPYEYIFSKVPGSNFSVSKLKPKTCIFYDFLEILINSNVFDNFKNNDIKSLQITSNHADTIYCSELLRENHNDEVLYFTEINEEVYEIIDNKSFDFIFVEIENTLFDDLNMYTLKMLEFLKIILKYQQRNGVSIIKIDNVFYKPIIDLIYILTSYYEKTFIVKPNASNITSFEKYIVCKNFIIDETKVELYNKNYGDLVEFIDTYMINLNNYKNENIVSIIDKEIPYHFINKIDDMNIIIGQQQLESINQIINILKNKNKEDKIESIKKTNIQKSVIWCEKFKIPCNKFSEKINIFLPIAKDVTILNDTISEINSSCL